MIKILTLCRLTLAVVGFILIVDCVILISGGSINFGTVAPFLIGVAFVAHGLLWQRVRQLFSSNDWLNWIWYGSLTAFLLWFISFIIFAFSLQQQIKQTQHVIPNVDAIMVLGAGTKDNKPSPLLAMRLDTAVSVIKKQPKALVITSGGKGFEDHLSSGQIMANYLHKAHNIPLSKVVVEGNSTSTEENFTFSVPLLNNHSISLCDPIAIVTSDFHIIRSKAIAKHQGFEQPVMVASPTPLSIRYNAWFREYFAFVSGWLLHEY